MRYFLQRYNPAGEAPIEGVSTELSCQAVKKHENRDAVLVKKFEDIPSAVIPSLREGDVVLTLGAGDIYKSGRMILESLGACD
jgi:UDP-N-acetylmuramate--alanine ligase